MADLTPLPQYDTPELDLPVGLAVLGGAVLGGLAGYLLLTARGMRLREEIEGLVDRLFDGLDTAMDSRQRAQRPPAERQAQASASSGPTPSSARHGRDDLT